MNSTLESITNKLNQALAKRKEESLYRSLLVQEGLLDFCSNDYLSFARSAELRLAVEKQLANIPYLSGSTGSRSISGNTQFAEELERKIARFHKAEAGLIFNSGYDANVGLFSSIAQKGDTIICDELIHASIIDGCRLSHANRFRFAHNDVNDLETKLRQSKGSVFVAVESVYSMDGDMAPLEDIASLCEKYEAALIVDEAHATGVFGHNGGGLVNHLRLENKVFARVHTFGKAIGAHGAIVLGNQTLRNYLINFARSFIFTTALPLPALMQVNCAYEKMGETSFNNSQLHELILKFKNGFDHNSENKILLQSSSAVQSVIIPGNEQAKNSAEFLRKNGFDVRAILSPSVPRGKERLRISLHVHNTIKQVNELLILLNSLQP